MWTLLPWTRPVPQCLFSFFPADPRFLARAGISNTRLYPVLHANQESITIVWCYGKLTAKSILTIWYFIRLGAVGRIPKETRGLITIYLANNTDRTQFLLLSLVYFINNRSAFIAFSPWRLYRGDKVSRVSRKFLRPRTTSISCIQRQSIKPYTGIYSLSSTNITHTSAKGTNKPS